MLVGTVATALISVPMSSRAEGGDARVGEVRVLGGAMSQAGDGRVGEV